MTVYLLVIRLMDFNCMADYGAKATQEGYDVADATDSQLIFSSEFNSPKIATEFSNSMTIADTADDEAINPHGLGYAPSHMCFTNLMRYGGNTYWVPDGMGVFALPYYDPAGATTSGDVFPDASYHSSYAGTTNVRTRVWNFSGGQLTYKTYQFALIEDNA